MSNFEEKYVIGCSFTKDCLVFCAFRNNRIELVSFDFIESKKYELFFTEKLTNFLKELQADFFQLDKIVNADKTSSNFLVCLQEYGLKFPNGFKFFFNNFPRQFLVNLYFKDFVLTTIFKHFWQKNKPINKGYINEDIINKMMFAKTDFALIAGIYSLSKKNDLAIFYLNEDYQENSLVLASVIDNQKKIYKTINFPHSLHYLKESLNCYFYENYKDFKIVKNNQKFSEKICQTLIDDLIFIGKDGSFLLNFEYFKLADKKYSLTKKFKNFLNNKVFLQNQPDHDQINIFMASIDEVFKRIVIAMLRNLQQNSLANNLVVLECGIVNKELIETIRQQNIFKEVHFQPLRREILKAIGSSLISNYQENYLIGKVDIAKTVNLSCRSNFNSNQAEDKLKNIQAKYLNVLDDEFVNIVFENLRNNKIILWFSNSYISDYPIGNRGLISCYNQKNINRLKLLRTNNSSLMLLKNNLLNFYSVNDEFNDQKIADNTEQLNTEQLQELYKFAISSTSLFHKVVQKYHLENKSDFLINSLVEISNKSSGNRDHQDLADYYHFFMNNDVDVLVVENFILFKEDQS